jgi:hypothetical protein
MLCWTSSTFIKWAFSPALANSAWPNHQTDLLYRPNGDPLPDLKQRRPLPPSPFLVLLLHCCGKRRVQKELISDLRNTPHPRAGPSHSDTETSNLKLWRQGQSGCGVARQIVELLARISIQHEQSFWRNPMTIWNMLCQENNTVITQSNLQ